MFSLRTQSQKLSKPSMVSCPQDQLSLLWSTFFNAGMKRSTAIPRWMFMLCLLTSLVPLTQLTTISCLTPWQTCLSHAPSGSLWGVIWVTESKGCSGDLVYPLLVQCQLVSLRVGHHYYFMWSALTAWTQVLPLQFFLWNMLMISHRSHWPTDGVSTWPDSEGFGLRGSRTFLSP